MIFTWKSLPLKDHTVPGRLLDYDSTFKDRCIYKQTLHCIIKNGNQLKILPCKASTAHFVEHTLLLNMSSNSSLQWMHFARTNKTNMQSVVLSKSTIINPSYFFLWSLHLQFLSLHFKPFQYQFFSSHYDFRIFVYYLIMITQHYINNLKSSKRIAWWIYSLKPNCCLLCCINCFCIPR